MLASQLNQFVRKTGLAQVLDAFPFAATLTNVSDQFVYANPAFTDLYGWHEAEIIGLKPMMLMPDGFSANELFTLRKRIADSPVVRLQNIRNKRKDGSAVTVSLETYQFGLSEKFPTSMLLGICSKGDLTAEASGRLVTDLLRFSHRIPAEVSAPAAVLDPEQQIVLLQQYGYTTKQIAAIMGLHPNTPYVILHRKRRRLAVDGK